MNLSTENRIVKKIKRFIKNKRVTQTFDKPIARTFFSITFLFAKEKKDPAYKKAKKVAAGSLI